MNSNSLFRNRLQSRHTRRAFLSSAGGAMGLFLGLTSGCGTGGESGADNSNPSADKNKASYPSKPLSIICPWAAGGGTDRLSRFLADELSQKLGQPAVVVNRTGGSGAVGHHAGATASPDGHSLLMATF